MQRPLFALLLLLSAGCSREKIGPVGSETPTPDASPTPTSTPAASCSETPARCTAWNVLESCAADGVTWTSETCDGGCYAGACSATMCADECPLGGNCQLWDMASGSFTFAEPVASTHDRARDYDARAFAGNLPHGGVANAIYTDPSFSQIQEYADLGDSALWTGSLLAAESWRYQATGAPAAAARMATLVETMHRNFAITQHPGYLARYAAPAGAPNVQEVEADCAANHAHCNVSYEGASWSWLGHTSRDQYTGVMLGLFAAYQASHDEAQRALIRADVVAVARELATVRTGVPVHVDLGGFPIDTTMDLENVILAPSETDDGRIWLVVDTGDFGNSDLYGAREFLPDVSVAITQIPGFGFVPPIKRASSAIMLGAFVKMGVEMTDGIPGWEADHAMLSSYYDAHADSWLADAKTWTFENNCGNGYYANHIAYISAYVWASLEKDPGLQVQIRDQVLSTRMWSALANEENSYFAFMHGGTRPSPDPNEPSVADAAADLAQFPAGPRVNMPLDLLGEYPHHATCTENGQPESTIAVSVADRLADDFIWQRAPTVLWSPGNPSQVYSGADYLAAYWVGRRHGLMSDDRPGTCARWAN